MKITSTNFKHYTTKRLKEIIDSEYGMNEQHTKDYVNHLDVIRSEYNRRMTKNDTLAAKKSIRARERSIEQKLQHALELIEAKEVEIEMLKRQISFAETYFLPPIIDTTPF